MLYFVAILLGLIAGSFLNVVIVRLHSRESLGGRSHCPACQHELAWHDLIPLASFFILRGRCRFCGKKISWQYPLVEAVCALLFALVAMKYAPALAMQGLARFLGFTAHVSWITYLLPVRDIVFLMILLIVFVFDLRHMMILDRITLPASVIALSLHLALGFSGAEFVISALALASFFALQFVISRGRWIGGGDIRLGFLVGMMLGYEGGADALISSYLIGAFVAILLIVFRKKHMNSQLPYGTFLALTAAMNILFGPQLYQWYFSFFSGL